MCGRYTFMCASCSWEIMTSKCSRNLGLSKPFWNNVYVPIPHNFVRVVIFVIYLKSSLVFEIMWLLMLGWLTNANWKGFERNGSWLIWDAVGQECVDGLVTRGSNTGGGENFLSVQTGSEAYQSPVQWEPDFFPGRIAVGARRWSSTLSGTNVKEREELYMYSPSVPTWLVEWNFFTGICLEDL